MPSDELCAKVRDDFFRSAEKGIEREVAAYVRERDLPKLIAVWPKELRNHTVGGTEHVISRIQKVIRACYAAGLRSHWSYDTQRHIGLLTALKAEQARLAHLIEERNARLEAAE